MYPRPVFVASESGNIESNHFYGSFAQFLKFEPYNCVEEKFKFSVFVQRETESHLGLEQHDFMLIFGWAIYLTKCLDVESESWNSLTLQARSCLVVLYVTLFSLASSIVVLNCCKLLYWLVQRVIYCMCYQLPVFGSVACVCITSSSLKLLS